MEDKFKFDPNSTENEGRWRLVDPEKFEKNNGWFRKKNPNYPGISYVFGKLLPGKENDELRKINKNSTIKQTIRFSKKIWTEKEASKWWKEHKDGYHREWTEKDWELWKQAREHVKVDHKKPREYKIPREVAIRLSKNIVKKLDLEYISQKEITIDYRFKKGVGFPVGSVRRGKKEVGDIDILITSPFSKEKVGKIFGDKITNLVGGEKKIDFDYHYTTRNPYQKHMIRVNLFVTLVRDSFGAALIHHTGPWEYNVYIRKKVKGFEGENWKLSQNGLMDGEGNILVTPTERILQETIGATVRTPQERRG